MRKHLATFGCVIAVDFRVHHEPPTLAQDSEAKHRPEMRARPVKGTVAALGVARVFGLRLATEFWATLWLWNP